MRWLWLVPLLLWGCGESFAPSPDLGVTHDLAAKVGDSGTKDMASAPPKDMASLPPPDMASGLPKLGDAGFPTLGVDGGLPNFDLDGGLLSFDLSGLFNFDLGTFIACDQIPCFGQSQVCNLVGCAMCSNNGKCSP